VVFLLTVLAGIVLSLVTNTPNAASATEHLADGTLLVFGIPAFLLGAYLESRKGAPTQSAPDTGSSLEGNDQPQ